SVSRADLYCLDSNEIGREGPFPDADGAACIQFERDLHGLVAPFSEIRPHQAKLPHPAVAVHHALVLVAGTMRRLRQASGFRRALPKYRQYLRVMEMEPAACAICDARLREGAERGEAPHRSDGRSWIMQTAALARNSAFPPLTRFVGLRWN